MKLAILIILAYQDVSSLMVAAAGMRLDSVYAFGLTVCKFYDGGWRWNEADYFDALDLTGCKFSDGS